MAGATGAERKGALGTHTSLGSGEAPQLTLSPHPQQSEHATRAETCEGAWCFLPQTCISERLRSLTEVKVEEEPHSVANIGRSPTHINSASSRMLSRSVLITSPACYRTLPVPEDEAPGMPGSLHSQEEPSPVGWDQLASHLHRVPVI